MWDAAQAAWVAGLHLEATIDNRAPKNSNGQKLKMQTVLRTNLEMSKFCQRNVTFLSEPQLLSSADHEGLVNASTLATPILCCVYNSFWP